MGKGMTFLTQYLLFWGFVAILGIVVLFAHGGRVETFECINGSIVTNEALCPDCLIDSDCGVDQICNAKNQCKAKSCITDSDCEARSSQCIYNQCVDTGSEYELN